MHKLLLSTALLFAPLLVHAQSRAPNEDMQIRDDVPIETYLALLSQVAPPAREGAEAYMQAFKARCGRALKTVELRRAFAEGSGDPTLMEMIRASHLKDAAALQRLAGTITCPRG